MDAESVNDYTKKLTNFGGIFSVNQLENIKIISFPVALIIHDNSHWVAIYLSENIVEVCDSSGYLKTEKLHTKLQKLLKVHFIDKKFFATPRLQSYKSRNCAIYCICFLFIRIRLKRTLCDFTSLFTTDKNVNCSIISNLLKEIEPLL